METVKVNENFLIHVNIKNGKNVFGFATFLNFPADAIEIIETDGKPEVTKGTFLGDTADLMPNLSINQSNNIGTLLVGYSLKGQAAEKNGEGRMFSIRARALKEGEHVLIWSSNSVVRNSKNEDQPNSFEDFKLKIEKENPNVNIVYIEVEKE